jgi:glycosyltransferase involved in cell wall biosynthesis
MRAAMTLSYVLPVHNQERVLESSVARLHERLREFPGSEILLVENGSSDGSAALCAHLAGRLDGSDVVVRMATSPLGMGHALRRGMALAKGDIVVLTAADLPFGFSDLDAYLALDQRPEIAIGSKAHPCSRSEIPPLRRAMSEGFRWVRLLLLGLRVRDSQGTILIDSLLSKRVQPHLASGDFLISTEIICWAVQQGAVPVELPVVYPRSEGSTVSPLRDSARMLAGIVTLRRRLHAAAMGAALQQS